MLWVQCDDRKGSGQGQWVSENRVGGRKVGRGKQSEKSVLK
jgi:hypothetical protein